MSDPVLTEKDLLNISPDDLAFYLQRMGWAEKGDSHSKFYSFKSPSDKEGNNAEFVFPRKRESSSFYSALRNIIKNLSIIKNTNQITIVKGVSHIDRDIMNLRVESNSPYNDSIKLKFAENLIVGASDLLKHAANFVENIKPYVLRTNNQSIEFAENCRFGHTFPGSFGISIESPLNIPTIGFAEINFQIPFERKALQKIFKGLTLLEIATNTNNPEILVENYIDGFNANMCDAILEVSDTIESQNLAFDVLWSPLVRTEEQEKISTSVKIDRKSLRYIQEVRDILKKTENEKEVSITGSVVGLKAPPGFFNNEDSERLVVIEGKSQDNAKYNLNAHLSIEDYRIACDAHKNGETVRVTGTIHRINNRWYLVEYDSFKILR